LYIVEHPRALIDHRVNTIGQAGYLGTQGVREEGKQGEAVIIVVGCTGHKEAKVEPRGVHSKWKSKVIPIERKLQREAEGVVET